MDSKLRFSAGMDIDAILTRLSMDKKAQLNVHKKEGKIINFVMLRGLGKPFIKGGIPEEILRETLEELGV